jgi:transposase
MAVSVNGRPFYTPPGTLSAWSNGQTVGHVHKLKLLKRGMYGRAKLDLLRLRLLNAA